MAGSPLVRHAVGLGWRIKNIRDDLDGFPSMAAAALKLAATLGPVLPLCWPTPDGDCGCGRRTKHRGTDIGKVPLTDHGFHYANNDQEQISVWWGQ